MKITVVGCGKIGTTVIQSLVGEGHDVVAVDNDPSVIDEITNIYNLSDKDNEDYIEQKAKEDGYLHAGERVFVNISGD